MDQTCWLDLGHLKANAIIFIMFLKPFLNNVCSVAGCIILL